MKQADNKQYLQMNRDNDWLADRLAEIWYRYFPDVRQNNEVLIEFGQKSRTRLGSIGMMGWQGIGHRQAYAGKKTAGHGTSVITITGYFKDERVPVYVVDATIGHELVHYAHGFHSPHPQLYRYPHQGGIVDKEMRKRGMGEILRQQKNWLKAEWQEITKPHRSAIRRKRRVHVRLSFL